MPRLYRVRNIAVFAFCIAICSAGVCSAQATLPDIPEWLCGELRITELDAVSGNQGFWVERDYRTALGVPVKAILMGGKGPRMSSLSPEGTQKSDGLLGAGSTYETLAVAGESAILEDHPVLGLSLVVVMDSGILTLESHAYSMEKRGMIAIAERIVSAM